MWKSKYRICMLRLGKQQNIFTSRNCENFVSWEDEILRFGVIVKSTRFGCCSLWGNCESWNCAVYGLTSHLGTFCGNTQAMGRLGSNDNFVHMRIISTWKLVYWFWCRFLGVTFGKFSSKVSSRTDMGWRGVEKLVSSRGSPKGAGPSFINVNTNPVWSPFGERGEWKKVFLLRN